MKWQYFFLLIPLFTGYLSAQTIESYTVTATGDIKGVYKASQSIYHVKGICADRIPASPFYHATETATHVEIISGKYNSAYAGKIKSEWTEDSPLLQIKSDAVVTIASPYLRSSTPVGDIATAVFRKIDDKRLGIPIISAPQILRLRAGDCTEHAVLTVAALRNLGIPSRAVTGLILSRNFMGSQDVFVFHMWVEAWYNNRWHLVDATRPGRVEPNRYIPLVEHSLKSPMPLDFLETVSGMNTISVEVISNQ